MRRKLIGTIMRAAEFPIESALKLPALEIKGDEEAYVSGCDKILEYTTENVVFEGEGFRINVSGFRMILEDYCAGCVCIRGEISTVSIERARK